MFCTLRGSRVGVRSIHTVPKLKYDQTWSQNGIGLAFSPKAYKIAWKDYQSYLTTELTLRTQGTDLENKTPFQVMLATHRHGDQASVFHYASQLYNNHLFFSSLAGEPGKDTSVPHVELVGQIEAAFGSMDGLKKTFIEKLLQLVGNGWFFLVETAEKKLQALIAHNDGSPYFYGRAQGVLISSPVLLTEYTQLEDTKEKVANKEQSWDMPLLAVSLWDHAYYHDYGMNKEEYLEKVWGCIDWNAVNRRRFYLK